MNILFQKIKAWILPFAMLLGAFLNDFFRHFAEFIPYLLFSMLFITYCKISIRDLKFTQLHLYLLLVQTVGCLAVYGVLVCFDPMVAAACLICVLAPTATGGAVITGMLGGNVGCLAAYTLLSSFVVALVSPFIFAFLGGNTDLSFWESVFYICKQVSVVLVVPCLSAFLLEKTVPSVHRQLKKMQALAFYLSVIGLVLITAKTVYFIDQHEINDFKQELWMVTLALVICILQFVIGRSIGRRYGETISGGQALGQKNTILAIWMTQMYLSPIISIAPASYVVWQNMINSYQLWKKERKKSQ